MLHSCRAVRARTADAAAALLLIALALTALPSTAAAAISVGMETDGSVGAAIVFVGGDDAADDLTVQRAPGGPTDPVGRDRVVLTVGSGQSISRDGAYNLLTSDFCSDITPREVHCYPQAGAAIETSGSNLGGGNDSALLVPGSGGPEIGFDIEGGDGNDAFTGGPGNDRFDGQNGSDTVAGNGGSDFLVDTGAVPGDVDRVTYADAAHTATGVNVTVADGIANDGTQGVDGAGPVSLDTVATGFEQVTGTDFDDFIFGTAEPETLVGGLGRDSLFGAGGADRLEARDATADATLNCGDGTDTAVADLVDATIEGCEAIDRPAAPTPTPTPVVIPGVTPAVTPAPGGLLPPALVVPVIRSSVITRALPDITADPFANLSLEGIEAELSKSIPVAIEAQPLRYSGAASRAKKAKVTPYAILGSSPNAGATVSGSLASPLQLKAFYWDPTRDLTKQACTTDPKIRPKDGRGTAISLQVALRGLGFREGTAGNEGDAQDLLRKVGCPYDASLRFDARAKEPKVTKAKFTSLRRVVRRNGRVSTTKVKGYLLSVTMPRESNDFVATFTQPVLASKTNLPISDELQLPVGKTVQVLVNVRERATGRIAAGTLAELTAPGGGVIASGKADSAGMVSLTAFVAAKGDYELYLSGSKVDPVTKSTVSQEGLFVLKAITPGKTWTTVGGSTISLGAGRSAARLQATTATDPISYAVTLVRELSAAATAKLLADRVALTGGLTPAQRNQLLGFYLQAAAVPLDSIAATTSGYQKLNLVPGIAATKTGALCPTWQAPKIVTRGAGAVTGDKVVQGRATGAFFDCGRAVMIDPTSGLALLGAGYTLGSALIANDGSSLIANDGASLIANDGASLIANDGASLIANDGASLIANDGASLVPVTGLLANDGASLISDHGAGLIANDGAGLTPIGGGTTFQGAGR